MLYFDNAATTFPKPINVIKTANAAITQYGGNPGRSGHAMAMRISEKIFEVRKSVGNFFNCEPQNVIFTQNCTMALNTAIKGLFSKSDHVLCSCLEHNSVLRPLFKLKQEGNIDYDVVEVKMTAEETVKAFAQAIKPNTKGIICTHASNVTGYIMPILELAKLCKKENLIFIVDGAQSGGVLPIDMEKMGINALCLPGHKGLYGITGSGLLLLRDCEVKKSLMEGGTGSNSILLSQPDFFPDFLESGTLNSVSILALGAGIEYVKKTGLSNIYSHEMRLCSKIYNSLSTLKNIRLYQPDFRPQKYLPIVSFNLMSKDCNSVDLKLVNSEKIVDMLNERNCALRGGLHCAPLAHKFYDTQNSGMVRFSPSSFTKEDEIVQFLKNVYDISKKVLI